MVIVRRFGLLALLSLACACKASEREAPEEDAGRDMELEGGEGAFDAAAGGGGGNVAGDGAAGGRAPREDAGAANGGAEGGMDAAIVERRLPLPCVAPLPTGYCIVGDKGDPVSLGREWVGGGPYSVIVEPYLMANRIGLALSDAMTPVRFRTTFAAPSGTPITPGLYEPVEAWPSQRAGVAGLSVLGPGASCSKITGKFSVEEHERDPERGLVRFSVTFEQHCYGIGPGLRGVVNVEARGTPDPALPRAVGSP